MAGQQRRWRRMQWEAIFFLQWEDGRTAAQRPASQEEGIHYIFFSKKLNSRLPQVSKTSNFEVAVICEYILLKKYIVFF